MKKILAHPARWLAQRAAASYVAGSEVGDALALCRRFAARGVASTICPWDGPGDSPQEVCASYHRALRAIKDEPGDCYLSLKVPSLHYRWPLLSGVLARARGGGTRVHFDALAPESASPALALFEEAVKSRAQVSYTLPARWKRSLADAERIIALGVTVRVVKGQWPDPAGESGDPNEIFLTLVERLAGRAARVAVATHNQPLAREALQLLQRAGTSCELEQLYGLPLGGEEVAAPLGIPMRIYIPYGHAYLAYALSEVRKRPVIIAWLLRDLCRGFGKRGCRGY